MKGLDEKLTVSKTYSINMLIRRFERGEVRRDNPFQRSPIWKQYQKDFLIVTAMHGWKVDPLKICEEVFDDGNSVLWLTDGGNRYTTYHEFRENMFRIGRNVPVPIIKYRSLRRNSEGKPEKDENNNYIYDIIEFNMVGKKYKDLPEELKDRFDNYEVYVDEYYECTSEEVQIHMQRFNIETPMNTIQKATTHMGSAAAWMKNITKDTDCRFFYEFDNYTPNEKRNGTLDRIVAESIMLIYHPDNWKKTQIKVGDYLSESASEEEFKELRTYLDRIYVLENEDFDIVSVFNAKHTFIWLALFAKFTKLGLEDSRFADFIREFKYKELYRKEINGESFESIDGDNRSSKDKRVVFGKLNILESLMMDFLSINKEDIVESFDTTDRFDAFATKFENTELMEALGVPMGSDIDRIAAQTLMTVCGKTDFSDKAIQEFITADEYTENNIEDVDLYLDEVNEWSLELPAGTTLLKAKYVPAMVGFVKYTYDNDTNTDALNWFKDYAFQCTKPENDVQKLLNDMKEDFNSYLTYKENKTA